MKNEFPCPEGDYGKVFGSNADRDRHVLSRSGKQNVARKLSVESLSSHIKVVHRGVYPFPCTRCERGFQNKNDLKSRTIVKHLSPVVFQSDAKWAAQPGFQANTL